MIFVERKVIYFDVPRCQNTGSILELINDYAKAEGIDYARAQHQNYLESLIQIDATDFHRSTS